MNDCIGMYTKRVTGRIMTLRRMGKAAFFRVQTRRGQLQIYVRKDRMGDDPYALFQTLDIGDIVSVRGYLFRAKTKELTVEAQELRLLTKGCGGKEMKKAIAKKHKPQTNSIPGNIRVKGFYSDSRTIPIGVGHLMRVWTSEDVCFHVTSYDGKNVELFVGGAIKRIEVEAPKSLELENDNV